MEWQWLVVFLLLVLGFVGLIIPMLPGVPMIFGGLLLAAWIDDFSKVSQTTMIIIGVLSIGAWVIDFFASYLTAKKAGASKQALWGALIGAFIGLFAGIVGLIIGPVIGAAIGELMAQNDPQNATRWSCCWLGFCISYRCKTVDGNSNFSNICLCLFLLVSEALFR